MLPKISKRKMFFHDMVNQTHAMHLWIQNKLAAQESLTAEEMKVLLKEIKMIQTLTKEFFQLEHRNLQACEDWVSFQTLQKIFQDTMKMYFSDKKYTFRFVVKDSQNRQVNFKIQFSLFQRICTNILKNIYDIGALEGEFVLENKESGASLQITNKVPPAAEESNERPAGRAAGLNGPPLLDVSGGIGLRSIAHLCQTVGGHFHFKQEGDYWTGEVFLPSFADRTVCPNDIVHKKTG